MATGNPNKLTAQDAATGWRIICEGIDPGGERGVEAALAVSNGAFGVRAALEEGNAASNPMLIVSGVYVPIDAPAQQTLLSLPDPASLRVSIDGRQLDLASVKTLSHVRMLDMTEAELHRAWTFVDHAGRTWRWESMRAASAADAGRYLHRLALTLDEGAPADVMLEPSDALAARYGAVPHIPQRAVTIAHVIPAPPLGSLDVVRRVEAAEVQPAAAPTRARVESGLPLRMDTVASLNRQANVHDQNPRASFDELLARHQEAWRERWSVADVTIDGDDELQRAIRFALYHVMSAANEDDGRTSVSARNLSGEAYHGHVFWDTEIFVLPPLAFARPGAARSCLAYRHRTLAAARERATALGYQGALYAWESTDSGEDRTPRSVVLPDGSALRILNGDQEHHISAAVPYAVIQYWRATGDDAFMRDCGAEILLQCALFWCSRASPAEDGYAIRNVIGPDEYHTGVDNDAYTNAMAAWTLREAASYLAELQAKEPAVADALRERAGIARDAAQEWRRIARAIVRSSFRDDQIVEQFDGFFDLEDIDVASYRRAGVPIDIAMGPAAIQRMRVAKQADVLMSAALLPEAWSEGALRRNFAHYEPLTAHTSSLSPPIHALLAAWLRDGERCRAYLEQTARIDLGDGFRGAAGGVHVAALGGLWQAVAFGLAGFSFDDTSVAFDPFLPRGIDSVACTLRWRGRLLRVHIDAGGTVTVQVTGRPCEVRVNCVTRTVSSDGPAVFSFDHAVTRWSAADQKGGGGHA
jgi:trehalose/maltose hydrolase-like predicted phosphorylase